jgi:hypothetical protein
MKNFLIGLFYENGSPSRTGLTSVLLVILYIVVSLYLVFTHNTWEHYEVFSYVTTGGGLGGLVGNKLINSKLSSPVGEPFNKGSVLK